MSRSSSGRDSLPSKSKESRSSSHSARERDEPPAKKIMKVVAKAPPTEKSQGMKIAVKEGVQANKKELYDSICELENNQAKELDRDVHLRKNLELCAEFEDLAAQLYELKTSGKVVTEEFKKHRTQGLMLLMKMRRMNRLFKLKLKITKEEVLEKRQEVDSEHLLLQNLLYETTHLDNQVLISKGYKGIDEKIQLIPVEQFYAEAPISVSRPELTKDNEYHLRIARLEYEYLQRQNLTEQVKCLEQKKTAMYNEINKQQANLSSIRPLLKSILEATKPAQKFFNMDLADRKVMYNLAKYLPTPLYILYQSSTGYESSSAKIRGMFHSKVQGDIESAKECLQYIPEIVTVDQEEESDMEKDPDEAGEIEESDRRKLRKRSSVFEVKEDPKKKLIQKHPMWVEWEITNKGSGDRITMQFFYLIKLGIITVKSKLEIVDETGKYTEVNLKSDNILCELFPKDVGLESPNPATVFMLERVEAGDFSQFIAEVGRPFYWAQKVSGINFLPDAHMCQPAQPNKAESTKSFTTIFQTILKRLVNQSTLWRQLKMIESRIIQIPPDARHLLPAKNVSTFVLWEPMDWVSYKSVKFEQPPLDESSSPEANLYFKAQFERGRAKMKAYVKISLDFPNYAPIFSLHLDLGTEDRLSENDSAIRDIEMELNIYTAEDFSKWTDQVLSFQLLRLAYCMDVLLETDSSVSDPSAGPSEFGREKLLLNPCRGINARRPFKFILDGGGSYLHRY